MLKSFFLTALAMLAFAANSVLCRIALGNHLVDPATFTFTRLLSGASALMLILLVSTRLKPGRPRWDVSAAIALLAYAVFFSFAYVKLATGTGALILFGSVQLGLIIVGLIRGERPGLIAWAGMLAAMAGLVYLVSPGLDAPEPEAAVLMALAGLAWAVYTLRGKNVANPLAATAWNFLATLPLAIILLFVFRPETTPAGSVSLMGIWLAILSGTLASGVGYAIWYTALRNHTPVSAAMVQLTVPLLAAWGGVIFMSEAITGRLVVSALVILGGLALYFQSRSGKSGGTKSQRSAD